MTEETAVRTAMKFIVAWEPTDGTRLPKLYLARLPEEKMRDPVSLLDPMQISTSDEHHAAPFEDATSANRARVLFEQWYYDRKFHIPQSGNRGRFPSHIIVAVLKTELA